MKKSPTPISKPVAASADLVESRRVDRLPRRTTADDDGSDPPLPRNPPVELDPSDIALIGKAEMLARVPISFVSVWRMMQEGRFPRARTIGNRVCWVKSEIDDWLAKVPVKAYRDDADGVRLPDPFRHEKRRAAKKAAPKKAGA